MNDRPSENHAAEPVKDAMSTSEKPSLQQRLLTRNGLITTGFLAVAGYFLWTEHEAHVIATLPWLLVGGCVFMHLFMHRGGHGGHARDKDLKTRRF